MVSVSFLWINVILYTCQLLLAAYSTALIPLLFCLFGSLISSVHGEWILSASTLPSSAYAIAVGAYNDTIFILGGNALVNRRQTTKYQIDTDTFTPITQPLHTALYGFAQCWSQLEDTMYMIEPYGSTLSTFNIITKQYTPGWMHLDTDVGNGNGCLAAANDHLFITGGCPNEVVASDTLQVLRLTELEWIIDTPPMQQSRCDHACVAHYNYLWVFGGWDNTTGALDTNERIDITNIASNPWDFIDSLSQSALGLRAAAWHQTIFVAGGYTGSIRIHTVDVVDAITGDVVPSPDRLVYGVSYHGIVVAQNAIYLFGGHNGNRSLDTWMRYELAAPTANPIITDDPTTTEPTTRAPTTANPTTTTGDMVTIVMVVSPVVMVVLLISLCGGICWFQKKKRVKRSVDFIGFHAADNKNNEGQINNNECENKSENTAAIADLQEVNKSKNKRIQRGGSVSLEEIGVTAEGNGDIVMDDGDTMCTREGVADEDQNHPNIDDDEFIVDTQM